TQGILVLIAVLTIWDYLRARDRPRLDIALMFGSLAAIVLLQGVALVAGSQPPLVRTTGALVFFAQPYFLLRLVHHFRPVRFGIRLVPLGGLITSWLVLVATPNPLPPPLPLFLVAYFVAVEGYAAVAFAEGAVSTSGVTHWRLLLSATGSGLLAAVILLAGLSIALPVAAGVTAPASRILAVLLVMSYYLGFTPPGWLRRTWQLAEVYRFLQETSGRPTVERASRVLADLCPAAMRAVGGVAAVTSLWDDGTQHLLIQASVGNVPSSGVLLSSDGPVGRAWQERRPRVARRPNQLSPRLAELVSAAGAHTLLAIPIASAECAWGILVVLLRHG